MTNFRFENNSVDPHYDGPDHYVSPQEGQTEDQVDPIDQIIEGVDPSSVDEDVLGDLIDQHPEARQDIARLREIRSSSQSVIEEAQQMTILKETRARIGNQIKTRLGIVEEDPAEQERRKEAERLHKLSKILVGLTHRESEDELMVKFGLIDDEGRITGDAMLSPLFKADTATAFSAYLSYVAKFRALEEAEAANGIKLANAQRASNLRGEAHNAVATLVERDLGLPFDQARRFVAKAREAKIPQSHEKAAYAQLLEGNIIATKFNHDAAAFTRDALKDVIGKPMDHERSEDTDKQ